MSKPTSPEDSTGSAHSRETFYITTAIDYVNSPPHLGTAYEKVTADVIARYKRLAGFDVHFLMGNDEHSLNVLKKAQELGKDPIVYTDEMEAVFRNVWDRLNVSYDDFIRTTQERHALGVVQLLKQIDAAGDIYEGEYEGWYCVSCESFKTEADLTDDGTCKIHSQRKPEWIKEKNYFFKLSKYKEPLLTYYDEHPELLEPATRRNEVLNMIQEIQDVSISRASQAWGIPLPQDPDAVIYVWFDALINYISAIGFGQDDETFAKWWPVDVHIIGKDITRFHNVIWPAMLLSAGVALPKRVFAHGWVHFQGRKMSKSDGTIVDPLEAAELYGPDPLRLYLVREIAYGNDGDFSWDRFEERYNADLANNFGNLVNRIAGMAGKYRDGDLPQAGSSGRLAGIAADVVKQYRDAFDRFALHEAANAAFSLLDATNEFIQESEPWALAKDESKADALSAILYDVAEAIRIGAILLLPVMPDSCAKVLERIGAPKPATEHTLDDAVWNCAGGRHTAKGDAIWPRIEKDV